MFQNTPLTNTIKGLSEGTGKATEQLGTWTGWLIDKLEYIIAAALVFVVFSIIARLVGRYADKLLGRLPNTNLTVNKIISALISFFVLLLGLFVSLSILGLDKAVTSMLAGAGLLGLALGFALQNIIINFISGIIIAFKTPIRIGELIETNGLLGTVRHIDFRATTIESMTGEKVVVPNRLVLENPLTNYSRYGSRRIDIPVGVSYNEHLPDVVTATRSAVERLDGLFPGKAIEVYFDKFDESSINFVVRFWIPYNAQSQYLLTKSQAIMNIHDDFKKAGITIPFPIRTFNMDKNDKLPFAES